MAKIDVIACCRQGAALDPSATSVTDKDLTDRTIPRAHCHVNPCILPSRPSVQTECIKHDQEGSYCVLWRYESSSRHHADRTRPSPSYRKFDAHLARTCPNCCLVTGMCWPCIGYLRARVREQAPDGQWLARLGFANQLLMLLTVINGGLFFPAARTTHQLYSEKAYTGA